MKPPPFVASVARLVLAVLVACSVLAGCDEATSAGTIQHPTGEILLADAELLLCTPDLIQP